MHPPPAPRQSSLTSADRLALLVLGLLGGAASVGLLAMCALYLPSASDRYIDRYAALILALAVYGPVAFIAGTLATRGFLRSHFDPAGASTRSAVIATAVVAVTVVVFVLQFR